MRKFLVLIGPRENPRLRLEVFATDAMSAAEQHACLCNNERMEVIPQ